MADYYFKKAALLRKRDIRVSGQNGLLILNIQKRLFLGVGGELLVKAFYLKRGYIVNSPKVSLKPVQFEYYVCLDVRNWVISYGCGQVYLDLGICKIGQSLLYKDSQKRVD